MSTHTKSIGIRIIFRGSIPRLHQSFAGELSVTLNLFAGGPLQDSPAKRLKETKFTREEIDATLRLTLEKQSESSILKRRLILFLGLHAFSTFKYRSHDHFHNHVQRAQMVQPLAMISKVEALNLKAESSLFSNIELAVAKV